MADINLRSIKKKSINDHIETSFSVIKKLKFILLNLNNKLLLSS